MKLKLVIEIVIIVLLIMISTIVLHFFIGNVSSKVPEEIKKVCNVKEERYQNRRVFILTPKLKEEKETVIYYLHGGSYVAELSLAHWRFLSKLTQDTKATIVVPDYPLTPQYHYTDAFQMVEPLYKEIIQKVGKQNLIVMGDSAGGGMALALIEKVGEKEEQRPQKTILISPWLDVSMQNVEIPKVQQQDKMLNMELLKMAGVAYSGSEENVKNYLVSPIYGPLENIGEVVIYTGTKDILNPDVHLLEKKAKEKRSNNKYRRNRRCRTWLDNSSIPRQKIWKWIGTKGLPETFRGNRKPIEKALQN